MRRRRQEGTIPAEFEACDLSRWPGVTTAEKFAAWRAARLAYCTENGWPGGVVDCIAGLLPERRRLGIVGTSGGRRTR